MNLSLLILFFFTGNFKTGLFDMRTADQYQYLALGDSYTIGEALPATENFPNQAVKLLNQSGYNFHQARIIAKTGWTTDELEEGIVSSGKLNPFPVRYDLVTLLIGVNNQYRGRSVENYKIEFDGLLKKAIGFAGNIPGHVMVLSIPDWGVTPFANGRDRNQIAKDIDKYNKANKEIAERYQVHYLDITTWTREAATDQSLLATDGLHPSGKEYHRWAKRIANFVGSIY